MFKRIFAVVRDALLVPFAPAAPSALPAAQRGAHRRNARPAPASRRTRPASVDASIPGADPLESEQDRFDAIVASIGTDELAAMEQSFTRSALAYAPAPGDVAAIRALFSATRLLGCEHDAERGSLRIATSYGDVVVATASEHAPTLASRFVPGECSVLISGYGRNTNLVAAGPGWQYWLEVAALSFDPGASH